MTTPSHSIRRKSYWIVAVILVAGIGAGAVYYRHRRNQETHYQMAAVTRGTLTQVVTATGQLNPVVNVQVGSQISGIIEKLFADFNSNVKAGDVVAQIEPSTYKANVHQAEGDLASSKAALELAELNLARKKELRVKDYASQSDLDSAQAVVHEATADVQVKEAALEKTQVDLARCTISSPIDGTVLSRSVDVGQTVAASLNAPTIFIIANDLTKMQIDALVAEADIGNVAVDQDVKFTVDAFPYRTFPGKVMQIRNSPTNTQNVVTYDTVIAVNNKDLSLRPGMTANVSIIVAQHEDVLMIPNAALRFRPPNAAVDTESNGVAKAHTGQHAAGGNGPGGEHTHARSVERTVYTLPAGSTSGQPQSVAVKIGISDGVNTEIAVGLNEGDLVCSGIDPGGATAAATAATNPFGGGRRF